MTRSGRDSSPPDRWVTRAADRDRTGIIKAPLRLRQARQGPRQAREDTERCGAAEVALTSRARFKTKTEQPGLDAYGVARTDAFGDRSVMSLYAASLTTIESATLSCRHCRLSSHRHHRGSSSPIQPRNHANQKITALPNALPHPRVPPATRRGRM
jgi:hypothetical protein